MLASARRQCLNSRLTFDDIESVSGKERYYEWLGDLTAVLQFDAAHPDPATPPGFSL